MKRITLFAMTRKGVAVAGTLMRNHPGMTAAVVSSRDENIADDGFDELASLCTASGVPFHARHEQPPVVATEYAMAVSWRWMLDPRSCRLIVLHDSLLPRHRGFNPLVTALIEGDERVGVTALYASGDYDSGDIIARSETRIRYPVTIQEAIAAVEGNYIELASTIASSLARDVAPPAMPQADQDASYSLWRDEEDYFIDWRAGAERIRRTVDALGPPYKGAATLLDGRLARIRRAQALPDVQISNRSPGKVIFVRECKPVVVCGQGLLRIDELADDDGASLLPLAKFRTRLRGPEWTSPSR